MISRKWNLIEEPRAPDIAILRKEVRNKEEEVLVPKERSFADYNQRILDVIECISVYEDHSVDEILNDLFSDKSDVLRIRISGASVETGSIPFLDGKTVIEGLKKVLIASACYVLDPKPFYPKLHRSEAEQLLRNCRLGGFETGSFVINIQFPLHDSYKKHDNPFPRKVTECLMSSLNRLVAYIDQQNITPSETLKPDSQINANLCLGLTEMKPSENKINLDFRMSWSSEIPVTEGIPEKITIYDDYVASIARLGQSLKPHKEVSENTFIGKVTSLNGAENAEGRMEGDVTMSLLVDEESLKARGFLKSDFYQEACDAHKTNKYIKISAVISEKPRCSDLDRITNFERLPN